MFIRLTESKPALEVFRSEVRDFCERELPAETKRKNLEGQHIGRDELGAWMQRLGARGWLTGRWPVAHGGLGWSPQQFAVFLEELGRAGAPGIYPFGVTMVGPVIYTFGTDEQKQRHLPDIARHQTWWCQGYSEPGAGSDLASLRTSAVRDGDAYVVNGQKIWTSYAHWADKMFCLVRTDPNVKKQAGISFLLIDMDTPGLTVRPIIGITRSHSLNEVFFEDVRVPVENLIGEEGKGWTYAKFLLGNERVGVADVGRFEGYLESLRYVLRATREGGRPLSEDPEFGRKFIELEVRLEAIKAMSDDQLAMAQQEGTPSLMGAAALKIRSTEFQQAALETIMEVCGRHGLAYQADAMDAGWNGEQVGPDAMAGLIHEHLYMRAATIYGGSTEVQKNIIAKGSLGL